VTEQDVVVIGAGPYGLSVAAHLRSRGLRTRIFGEPMETWRRHMPAGMFLKSEGFASSLSDPDDRWTLGRFCAETGADYEDVGAPVPLETFVSYGRWFAAESRCAPENARVQAVRCRGPGFEVELAGGETLSAAAVVVATGVSGLGHVPPELATLPPERMTHSSEHTSFAGFAGREVGVIGGGQSALESAALLHEAGAHALVMQRGPEVVWAGRPPIAPVPLSRRLRWPLSPLGTGLRLVAMFNLAPGFRALPLGTRDRLVRETLGPAGAWWLRSRIEGSVPVLTGQRLSAATASPDGVTLQFAAPAGRRVVEVDHVIAATGYHVDLRRYDFLAADVVARLNGARGYPRLSPWFESSLAGLYFVGLPAALSFGPVMRFVCGADVAARRVAHHLARAGRRAPKAQRTSVTSVPPFPSPGGKTRGA
jgi:cation diffusion facilitator CzcD-associated flavoprotein CzcO